MNNEHEEYDAFDIYNNEDQQIPICDIPKQNIIDENFEIPSWDIPKQNIIDEQQADKEDQSLDDSFLTDDRQAVVSLLQFEKKKQNVNQYIVPQGDIVDQVIRDSRGKEFRNREFKINFLKYTIRDILLGNKVIQSIEKLTQAAGQITNGITVKCTRSDDDQNNFRSLYLPLNERQFFTLGKSSYAIARKQIQDEIIDFYLEINQACVQEENMAPIHLIVYYGLLQMTQNYDLDGFHDTFRKGKQYLLSKKALTRIFEKSSFQFAPRFGIMDISTDQFSNHVCIGVGPVISNVHVEMKKGNSFLLGTNVEMRVKEIRSEFKHFINNQSPRNNQEQNSNRLIYNVLRNIKAHSQINFVGMYPSLTELFDDVGSKINSEYDFMDRLALQQGVLQNKLDQVLKSGYLQLELKCEDTQSIKNYIVIKDNNNEYPVGRDTSNRIVINVISVSRFHCTIRSDGNQWFIYDGVRDGNDIRTSKYGTWKKVNDQNFHYVEQNQEVRIGLTKLTFQFPSGY